MDTETITLRIRGEILLQLREAARDDGRTLNGMVARLLEEALATRRKPKGLLSAKSRALMATRWEAHLLEKEGR